MKRKLAVAAVGAAVFLGGLTGCAKQVDGTVIDKEYEPRNCERREGSICERWDPAEYELTIRLPNGTEEEWVVSKDIYDRVHEGDTGTWKGRRD